MNNLSDYLQFHKYIAVVQTSYGAAFFRLVTHVVKQTDIIAI